MAKGKALTAEERAMLHARLLAGDDPPVIAREMRLNEWTVYEHRAKHIADINDATNQRLIQKKQRIEELFFEALEARLEADIAISRQFTDTEWLAKQEAGALATAGGINTDKLVRMRLAAGGRTPQQDKPEA